MTSAAIDLSGPTFDGVAVGDELPTLVLPITRTLIVSGAIASRDYQDVHHDSVLAKERGSKDIFMNILTTNGLVGRYVTDWSGPRGRLSQVNIRLGAPNYPGAFMTLTGSVTEKGPVANDMLWWLNDALLTLIAVRQNAMLTRSWAGPGSPA